LEEQYTADTLDEMTTPTRLSAAQLLNETLQDTARGLTLTTKLVALETVVGTSEPFECIMARKKRESIAEFSNSMTTRKAARKSKFVAVLTHASSHRCQRTP